MLQLAIAIAIETTIVGSSIVAIGVEVNFSIKVVVKPENIYLFSQGSICLSNDKV